MNNLYGSLSQSFVNSAGKELTRIKSEYPYLYPDVYAWTFHGLTMGQYEKKRLEYIEEIKTEGDERKKKIIHESATQELRNAAKWFAFQMLFEDAYRDRFAVEVVTNMLRDGRYTVKDIVKIVPYLDELEIEKMKVR